MSEPDTMQNRAPAVPWATALIAVAAVLATAVAPLHDALMYDRTRILAGEFWRLWTGHLVHFGWSHFGWNVVVLAVAGTWSERIATRRTRILYLLAPLVIGLVLLATDTGLDRFAGLSGIAAATVGLLALVQLTRTRGADAWFWRGVLGLLLLKVGVELATHGPIFARFSTDVEPVPMAHVAGIVTALMVQLRAERHRRRA